MFVCLSHSLLIHEDFRSHTTTHHSRYDFSGRVISCRRDPYLSTHNTHKRQTSMLPVGFKPTISADERPQTYALDRAATGADVNGYEGGGNITFLNFCTTHTCK